MNWIRTYYFVWLNLDHVSCIRCGPVFLYEDKITAVGYKIVCETPGGDAVLIGCVVKEADALDCMESLIAANSDDYALYSEEEIRAIYIKKKPKKKPPTCKDM